ncbi:hypothetical protein [Pragia fontium]|uniref:hypothetical protein n=1 Tax=Pragia fontium TaxID=82985 RepID=UPI00064B4C34|nr:hypothetical protein [Pragia fontium]AKJ41523.1 hypothetical protein QQ39_05035 [Pragia fontium]
MNKIKRYTPDYHVSLNHEAVLMHENENGSYVKYEDHKLLLNSSNNSIDNLINRINDLLDKESDPNCKKRLAFALGLCASFRYPDKNKQVVSND